MAKKEKNIKNEEQNNLIDNDLQKVDPNQLNNQEVTNVSKEVANEKADVNNLDAVEIVNLEKKEKARPLTMIIIFIILLATVFGMPYINQLIEKIKGNEIENIVPADQEKNDQKDKDKEEAKFQILTTANFTYRNLNFSNFKLIEENGPKISFDIAATKDNVNIEENNYYLELYSNNQMMLQRIKLSNPNPITKNPTNLKFEITSDSYNNTTLVRIVQKSVEDYPRVILKTNAEGEPILTCNSGNQKLVYYFKSEKLTKIEDIMTYTKTADLESYSNILTQKQSEVAELNNKNGITSTLVESQDNFLVNTLINLKEIDKEINNKNYYSIDTLAKQINFEMKAKGYTCQ